MFERCADRLVSNTSSVILFAGLAESEKLRDDPADRVDELALIYRPPPHSCWAADYGRLQCVPSTMRQD
jgi:hypothetical protein